VSGRDFQSALLRDPELCQRILADPEHFPHVPEEPQRIIKASPENIERGVCRAIARCREWGQFWRVEVAG